MPSPRALLAAAALILCQGCGFYYKALKQEAVPSARITRGGTLHVRPISFEKMSKPGDYETEKQWREETRGLIPEYNEELSDVAGGEGLSGRIKLVKPDEKVTVGILVEAEVVDIRRDWNAFAGGFDYLVVQITFTDVASGEKLYKGQIEASSKRYGPVGWRAQAFPGRLALASWNVVTPIVSIIKSGKITPEQD